MDETFWTRWTLTDRPLYAVVDWWKLFETAQTRNVKKATWFACPNKLEGKGRRILLRRENGEQLFCAFIHTLEIASLCPVRGILADKHGPLDAYDLADKSHVSPATFEDMLSAVSHVPLTWLRRFETACTDSTLSAVYECIGYIEKAPKSGVNSRTSVEAYTLAKRLLDSLDRKPITSTSKTWAPWIQRLLNKDVKPEEIARAIDWLAGPNKTNNASFAVQCGRSLFEKWDRIIPIMARGGAHPLAKPSPRATFERYLNEIILETKKRPRDERESYLSSCEDKYRDVPRIGGRTVVQRARVVLQQSEAI